MRLTNVTITNFGPHRHLSLPLAPLTVITGGNGTGKSSIADPREAVRIGEAILISPDATWHRPLTTLEMAALQCGICTPGVLVAAKALLEKNPDPTEEEIRFGLAGNLCRCTGYDKIVRAVQDAAKVMRG